MEKTNSNVAWLYVGLMLAYAHTHTVCGMDSALVAGAESQGPVCVWVKLMQNDDDDDNYLVLIYTEWTDDDDDYLVLIYTQWTAL